LKIAILGASQAKATGEAAEILASSGIPVIPCNWRSEKQADGTSKINKKPLIKAGVYGATTDLEQVRAWCKRWPKALIGVPMGRRTGIWVVDVDTAEAHGNDGLDAWTKLEIEHDEAATRTHQTGTGGIHQIYLWNPDRPIGCPTGKLPQGMEVKGEGGYVIFPPSRYVLGERTVSYQVRDDICPAAAPTWLYDLILGERQRPPKGNGAAPSVGGPWAWPEGWGEQKLEHYCELIRSAGAGERDLACRKTFWFARCVGGGAMDIERAKTHLVAAAKENEIADAKALSAYVDKVERTFSNGVADPAGPFFENEGVSLNDFHAYMPQHSYIYVPTREHWPASSVNVRIPSVDNRLKASSWLDENRPVEQMTWAPGEGMLVRNRLISEGGWIEKNGVACFNLYRPPTIKPGNAAQAGLWIDHIRKVFGEDAEHIITWCAHRVQHPEVKINHALVLGSEKHGTGKDTMLEPVKRAIGPWNFGEVSPQQMLGRFNGFLKRVILRVNEARDLGEMSRYQFYDHMKAYTAAPPDVLRVDEKFLREHSILNCVGIILTTNYRTNGIYLPAEDRRHYVAWSNLSPDDFAEGYWNGLWRWYDSGGDSHVAALLAGYDLSAFDPKAPPRKTNAFWDIVDANRAPEDSELADVLDLLGNPTATTLREISRRAGGEFGRWLSDHKNRRLIPHRFAQCGYVPVRNPDRKDHYWIISSERQVVYALSELSLRDQLKAAKDLAQGHTNRGELP
jgi:hypothetical protein